MRLRRAWTDSGPRARWSLLIFLLLILASPALASEPKFPPLTGRVVDDAGVLNDSTRSELTLMLAEHERATGQQVVVVTVESLQGFPIEDYGYQLGRRWGIGQKGPNTGALLIVAPKERKVRIEVGYGLEGMLTDAASRVIIERDIKPNFLRGDFNAGILAGTTSMLRVLGGNPPEIGEPATSFGEGHFTPTVSVKVKPPSVPLYFLSLLLFLSPWIIWVASLGFIATRSTNRRGGSYGWDSDGGSSGGSSSGGESSGGSDGFSGGGGSFGGGGASGSW